VRSWIEGAKPVNGNTLAELEHVGKRPLRRQLKGSYKEIRWEESERKITRR
jgi:hypothetical protein